MILKLVQVPAGEFIMGSPESENYTFNNTPLSSYEKPQHKVNLDEFLIGQYDVTNAQFAAFIKAAGYKTSAEKEPTSQDHPVVWVSWNDAQAFCQWASKVSGRKVQLPSEAQWEKAARSIDGRVYPWGNEPPDDTRLNYQMSVGGTTPVGQYSAGNSPYGAADMAGNVAQWTSSLFKPYPYRIDDGRENPSGKGNRVLRGGGFMQNDILVRSAARYEQPAGYGDGFIGFRVVVLP